MPDILFENDTFAAGGILQVTENRVDDSLTSSIGRASYAKPVRLWDAGTGRMAGFTTHFSFAIKAVNDSLYGDGLSFFLAPFDSRIPENSSGGYLALFTPKSAFNTSQNQIIAVEFDSRQDDWDPSSDHVGINVNSIVSVTTVTWKSSIKNGSRANAWVSYNSTTHNLSVFLTYADNPVFSGNSSLSYTIDLRKFLPERIRVGFSAATGKWIELHTVYSWEFDSTLEDSSDGNGKKIILVVLLVVIVGVLTSGFGVYWLIRWRKGGFLGRPRKDYMADLELAMDDEFEKGTGPKRFTYRELSQATNNFSDEGKLGQGGFGGVYKGLLSDSKTEVAVKRVSRGSKQGKKEYVSEVKIISRLRHRNLVQLIGWCHENGEFLLVYEFMPNGSLDTHLFGGNSTLEWTVRYKIALGLASSLLYLHEEWEQCVVHRDIKSSNIMLDSYFNAKLGDFGLARLVDHDQLGSQTTVLAGTMGYLAPECVTTGQASKESDVYSFGVVALEIACGRRPLEPRVEPSEARLVEWVWGLYGKGLLPEAADKRLSKELDERQRDCLMTVGLWCCHPDSTHRPSIRQVINVLSFQAPLPNLPMTMPVPVYYAPPMHMCNFSYTSSASPNDAQGQHQSGCSCNTCTSYSSTSLGSSKALLNLPQPDVLFL